MGIKYRHIVLESASRWRPAGKLAGSWRAYAYDHHFLPRGLTGTMTLITLGDKAGTTILIDCNIRAAADDPDDATRDVAGDLRDRLKRDSTGRPFVDVYISGHPDQDHCRGLKKHFHLGAPKDYPDDKKPDKEKKIMIGETWSSPIVFRRASKEHTLCEDALAYQAEVKRRIRRNRDAQFSGIDAGDRVLILGDDEDGKTDDLRAILVRNDENIDMVNGVRSNVSPSASSSALAADIG